MVQPSATPYTVVRRASKVGRAVSVADISSILQHHPRLGFRALSWDVLPVGQRSIHDESAEGTELARDVVQRTMTAEEKPVRSSLSFLMILVTLFSGLTGLLMGYDLCIVAVIIKPITDQFSVCHTKAMSPMESHNRRLFGERRLNTAMLSIRQAAELTPNHTRSTDFYVESFNSSYKNMCLMRPCLTILEEMGRKLQEGESSLNPKERYQSCPAKQLFVSLISPGAMIGSLFAGFIADTYGRRLTLGLSDALIMGGSFMMAFSQAFSLVVAGRFLIGLGIGTGFVTFSTYVSEISPDDRRGQLVSFQEVAQCIGCLAAYCIAAICNCPREWRAYLIAAGIVALLQICSIALLPESPRWLIRKNKRTATEKALRRLAGLPPVRDDEFVNNLLAGNIERLYDRDEDDRPDARKRQKERSMLLRRANREEATAKTFQKMIEEIEFEKCRRSKQKDVFKDFLGFRQKSWPYMEVQRRYRYNNNHPLYIYLTQQQNMQRQGQPLSSRNYLNAVFTPYMNSEWRPLGNSEDGNAIAQEVPPLAVSMTLPPPVTTTDNDDYGAKSSVSKFTKFCYPAYLSQKCSSFSFFFRTHRWQLCIAIGCAICQNLTGSTAILYYSTEIFRLAGVENPFLAGIGIGLAKVAGIVLVIFYVEQFGRRRFLLLGSIGSLICHLAFSVVFLLELYFSATPSFSAVVAIITMIFYMFFQNVSWAGLMFVVASEVLPSDIRSVGMGITITTFWILAFVTQSTLETLMELITIPGVFFFYACASLLATAFTFFCIPELSGKSLEEIAELFD